MGEWEEKGVAAAAGSPNLPAMPIWRCALRDREAKLLLEGEHLVCVGFPFLINYGVQKTFLKCFCITRFPRQENKRDASDDTPHLTTHHTCPTQGICRLWVTPKHHRPAVPGRDSKPDTCHTLSITLYASEMRVSTGLRSCSEVGLAPFRAAKTCAFE